MEAIVRWDVSWALRIGKADRLASVRNISSSVQGTLNSLGKEVMSSIKRVYSKSAVSKISAVSGSILIDQQTSPNSTSHTQDSLKYPEMLETT